MLSPLSLRTALSDLHLGLTWADLGYKIRREGRGGRRERREKEGGGRMRDKREKEGGGRKRDKEEDGRGGPEKGLHNMEERGGSK